MKRSGIAVILLVLSGVFWFTSGIPPQKGAATPSLQLPTANDLAAADIRVEDMHATAQAATASEWEVFAREAKIYQAAQRTELYAVAAHLLRPADPPVQMTAERGYVDSTTGNMAVEGAVRLQYQSGYTIATDTLHWHAADGTLYTEAPVSIYNPSVQIAGTGLQSKVDQQQIAIRRDVRAFFRLPGDQ